MICSSCQEENRPDARFCDGCGRPLARVCASCGRELRPDARFCDGCGQAAANGQADRARAPDPAPERDPRAYTPRHLAEKILTSRGALEGERKQVSVLFADVHGSMELAERIGPEEWHRILDRFFQILIDGVHRFEGTVNQFTGDGVMALFGAPIAHEDHAQRACYAALHLPDELRQYANELRVERGLNFAVRIGINSGEVVVAKIGDDLRMDYTAQGHTVGLAARMEQIAEPGKAYLTEHTARLVKGYFDLADLGRTEVKGASAPVGVYELLGPGTMRTRLDVSRSRGLSRFVGRDQELETLKTRLERAHAGEGGVIGVVGQPGVGKSRLCSEFVDRARAGGTAIYEAHCPPHGRTIPFLPLLELLRGLFDIAEGEHDHEARRKIAGELLLQGEASSESLPLIFDFLGVPDPARPAPPMDPGPRQERLFDFVRRLVRARAERGPSLLFVDDVHWIDAGSEAFLTQIAEAVRGTRALLLLNFRPEYRFDWTADAARLSLRPLEPGAIDELLAELLGRDPSVAALPALIRTRTAGNPFFVEELVCSLVEAGTLQGEPGAYRMERQVESLEIPPTVEAVLAARIDRLNERDKQVLQTAAVIGREFTGPVLERVIELPEVDLAASLSLLETAEFIAQESLYPVAEYVFRHPLTQEVAYASQLSERRAGIHADVAQVLEVARAEHTDEQAPLLAHHWESAGEALQAARWHRRAARWVEPRDLEGALRHWRRVRELLPEPDDPEPLALAIETRANILTIGGAKGIPKEEAEALLAEGRQLAERAGDDSGLAALLSAYALACIHTGDFEEALECYLEVERAPDAGATPGFRAFLTVSTAHALSTLGRFEEVLARIDAVFAWQDSDPEQAAAAIGELGPTSAGIYCLRADALRYLGRLDEAEADVARVLALDASRAGAQWVGLAHATAASVALLRGDPKAGRREAARALEIGERIGYLNARLGGLMGLGAASLVDERWEEAAGHLETAWETTQRSGNVAEETPIACMLSRLYLATAEPERAAAVAKGAITVSALRGARHQEAEAQIALALVRVRSEGASAAADIEAALARASALVEETGARVFLPEVCEVRAELASQRGDGAAAERALREAEELLLEMGAPWRAEALRRRRFAGAAA